MEYLVLLINLRYIDKENYLGLICISDINISDLRQRPRLIHSNQTAWLVGLSTFLKTEFRPVLLSFSILQLLPTWVAF